MNKLTLVALLVPLSFGAVACSAEGKAAVEAVADTPTQDGASTVGFDVATIAGNALGTVTGNPIVGIAAVGALVAAMQALRKKKPAK